MGDGRPTCNRVLILRVPWVWGIPWIPVGMGWVWGLKCHPRGSPVRRTVRAGDVRFPWFEVDSLSTFNYHKTTKVTIGLYKQQLKHVS